MNQDETTKALSDKVLDRSIIIHFPRPTELKRRLTLDRLRRQGVLTLDVPADELSVAVINKYLELKAKTLI